MQINRTPQITFGIKHSPLLGQLKPIERPRSTIDSSENTRKTVNTTRVYQTNETVHDNDSGKLTNGDISHQISNNVSAQRIVSEANESSNTIHSSRVTQIRADTDIRSSTATPEPVQETLTQEIVWVPEKPVRRGSYTIEKSDLSNFLERYEDSGVVPVENGVVKTAISAERGAACSEESDSKVIRREGFEQNVQRNVKNASAHEKSQVSTEEVRSGTDVQHLPNGGISKTTTTTTVKKIGTTAKIANASTSVIRTSTAVTSRDVGAK